VVNCRLLHILALAGVAAISLPARGDADALPTHPEISGAYYDWKVTLKPEQPWRHDHSQTLVMKMPLGTHDKSKLDFAGALAEIKKIDNLTVGIPKIIYLVGWWVGGDSGSFPSLSIIDPQLKRPEDRSALDGLHWIIREARKYHTVVSLHINMVDAYEESPLWREYLHQDVILKDKNGKPIPGLIFDGVHQSYQISYAQEWKVGLAQKRIDDLLNMLPELADSGTIHIDAFDSIQPTAEYANFGSPYSSPYLGLTVNDEIEAQRKIFRYFRKYGIDVTAEGAMVEWRKDPFIGLQPMAWWFDEQSFRLYSWIGKPPDFKSLPPQLYVGTPMKAEQDILEDPERLHDLLRQFCWDVLPWYNENNTAADARDKALWQKRSGDVFMPAPWLGRSLVAFSERSYGSHKWRLPES
jgi:hypothetical protein